MSWSTEELRAYLAGEATEADATAIEAALVADPKLEDQLMALDPLAGQLHGAAALIDGPSDAQIGQWRATPPVQPAGFEWRHMAAAAVVGAVIVGAGWLLSAQSTPDWRAEVATYQALYGPETIATIAFDDDDLTAQVTSVGARVGFNNLIQVTDNIDDIKLLRAQILSHEGRPLGQIVFTTADGQPVALCLIGRDGDASQGIKMANRAGLASASFESENHSWLLIGTNDAALIARTAEQVMAKLTAL